MTMQEDVMHVLSVDPNMHGATATQIMHVSGTACKLSSLSSILNKMHKAGELERYNDFGPQGGYVTATH